MFTRVLVANRGEIAVRILRTLRKMGIESVTVHSDAEADAVHVRAADQAVCIGPGPVSESYLRIDRVLDAARRTGAQAVHPGYGLLAENPEFAEACERAGLVFIGPTPEAIRMMGSKIEARRAMSEAGVPVVPGALEPVSGGDHALALADSIGYPIAAKASGAGGGKGFRVARDPGELPGAVEGARSEGVRFFADPTVYLERYLDDPRHIEVQLLGDTHGNVVHLFERDCTIQRRHQKLVEEAPAPRLPEPLRTHIGELAITAAKAIGYHSAGTVEGLLAGDEFFFLEMNTRIQVEHCVTEMVTGINLVEQQVRVAAGERLSFGQTDLRLDGHAIECRINAENAAKHFLPAPGTISGYQEPRGAHVRVDSGVGEGSAVLPFYDPMIAKLIVWGEDRATATDRMLRALDEFRIEGVTTLLPFHRALLASDQWRRAESCRDLLEDSAWLKQTARHE
ncbi:acetyl/propionyl/methylcrotonyl-CoA carboxylase subunit alpha [Saccharopolyspora sp. ASAGF58]|uniref:acetyl-CoA carboxylase biotin carboxylase subunit n=1 Tax=Saccharopolyspora sp. ASAGF58 TaxID=2719023 RepID=UPI00143FEBD8|nr:acetyl-CoA carboxylase biotin carboxylase subunit [Saccharopolyspora sp. ASAGF58]QIZ37695.1 acetyl-CoA carboxylase biotin carboxylase subunit [Saccharopolyspora sp. ASAGF58]